jgi:hypothetical protein
MDNYSEVTASICNIRVSKVSGNLIKIKCYSTYILQWKVAR